MCKVVILRLLHVPYAIEARNTEIMQLNIWLRSWYRKNCLGYMDHWRLFQGRWDLHKRDGLHLNWWGISFWQGLVFFQEDLYYNGREVRPRPAGQQMEGLKRRERLWSVSFKGRKGRYIFMSMVKLMGWTVFVLMLRVSWIKQMNLEPEAEHGTVVAIVVSETKHAGFWCFKHDGEWDKRCGGVACYWAALNKDILAFSSIEA